MQTRDNPSIQALLMMPSECAQVANVSTRTITRMCESGQIKAVKIRGSWRINREAFMCYIGIPSVYEVSAND